MGLNEQKGNMYPWVTHTWNTVKGKCPHDCEYCYMNIYPLKPVRFDESELKTDLGNNNFIFVGSSCDMWANKIPDDWIRKILEHLNKFNNTYLFQSKNPHRFLKAEFLRMIPLDSYLGTTIETNRDFNLDTVPNQSQRYYALELLKQFHRKTMVSIEPIMDFDVDIFSMWINIINPEFISIGADSKGHNLSEPSSIKVKQLIKSINQNIEVKLKNNLNRIIKEEHQHK